MKRKVMQNSISYLLMVVFLIIALFTVIKLDGFWKAKDQNRPEEIKRAILNASVQCYALEGSYPPDLSYLQEHYGIQLEPDRYFYLYEVFASNVMPDVEVYEK